MKGPQNFGYKEAMQKGQRVGAFWAVGRAKKERRKEVKRLGISGKQGRRALGVLIFLSFPFVQGSVVREF